MLRFQLSMRRRTDQIRITQWVHHSLLNSCWKSSFVYPREILTSSIVDVLQLSIVGLEIRWLNLFLSFFTLDNLEREDSTNHYDCFIWKQWQHRQFGQQCQQRCECRQQQQCQRRAKSARKAKPSTGFDIRLCQRELDWRWLCRSERCRYNSRWQKFCRRIRYQLKHE